MKNKNNVADLQTKGYMNAEYPPALNVSVNRTIETWKEFCALPESERVQFPYNSAEGMGVGYELKKTPGSSLDLKEDFHFTLGHSSWLREMASHTENDIARRLVLESKRVCESLEPLVLDVALEIEKKFYIKGLADEIHDSKNNWYLRFLHYFGGRKIGDEIATSHADKSGLTFHVYESAPGLQYLDQSKKWRDVPVSKGESMIIPGMRMQYRSQNLLKATYHRVIADREVAKRGRYSMVCFVHLDRTPQYDKKRAGRLQEFPPGFNYDMSFEEFSKLFILP